MCLLSLQERQQQRSLNAGQPSLTILSQLLLILIQILIVLIAIGCLDKNRNRRKVSLFLCQLFIFLLFCLFLCRRLFYIPRCLPAVCSLPCQHGYDSYRLLCVPTTDDLDVRGLLEHLWPLRLCNLHWRSAPYRRAMHQLHGHHGLRSFLCSGRLGC